MATLALLGVGFVIATLMENGQDDDATDLETKSTAVQESISKSLVQANAVSQSDVTVSQIMQKMTFKDVHCGIHCDVGLALQNNNNTKIDIVTEVSQDIKDTIQTNFSQATDAVIDAMVDSQREFLSPEDKRKYTVSMKDDMSAIINTEMDANALSEVFSTYTGSQEISNITVGPWSSDCNPKAKETTYCFHYTNDFAIDLACKTITTQVFTLFEQSDSFQSFKKQMTFDYKYKATGPIGEYFRGLSEVLDSIFIPLAIGGVVIAVIFIVMMFMGNKKTKYKNFQVGTPNAAPLLPTNVGNHASSAS